MKTYPHIFSCILRFQGTGYKKGRIFCFGRQGHPRGLVVKDPNFGGRLLYVSSMFPVDKNVWLLLVRELLGCKVGKSAKSVSRENGCCHVAIIVGEELIIVRSKLNIVLLESIIKVSKLILTANRTPL